MDKEQQEKELMSVVSYLYYYADMNQSDIAARLFQSRSTISRLLKKARASGVVELKINEPWHRDLALEDTIKTAFSIDRVRVLKPNASEKDLLDILGKMTSFYISCAVQDSFVLGLSWGNTIAHVVDSMTTNLNIPVTVVPIMGSMSWPVSNVENQELSARFSKIYGGRYLPLEAPLYARTRDQHQELMNAPGNAEALEIARKADIILTSVGSIESRSWENVIGTERLNRLCALGCVGHIGGHFYDINGCEIEGSYKDLLVGMTLDEIRDNHNVICAAASAKKAEAVYGALRGRFIDELFITQPLAEHLMEIADSRRL